MGPRSGDSGKRTTKKVRAPAVRSTPAPRSPAELGPLTEDAFHGLAGEIVREIEPHSEADPAAILAQLLAAFGNVVGRGPGFQVEATRHHANLFVGIVGETAAARKGTSLGQALHLITQAAPDWTERIKSGSSSGEGLIWEVRDAADDDPGVDDKRLLVVETELASPLERMGGAGNTLSHILRQAWDGGKLDTLVKTNRATATGAHLSMIGHITAEELQRKLNATEQANGFANRILWIYARRSKYLPRGGDINGVNWQPYLKRLRRALRSSPHGNVDMTASAWRLWEAVYRDLSDAPPGMLGATTARASAQVRRLALVYALLDSDSEVDTAHLRAALALWRYSADTAALLFGDSLGDPTADAILRRMRGTPQGMTLKEIYDSSGRHFSKVDVDRALHVLENLGLAGAERERTGGRPATRWRVTADSRTKRSKRAKPTPKKPKS